MNKIELDTIKPWIRKRITELLGKEDDAVIKFVINQLEADTVCNNLLKCYIKYSTIFVNKNNFSSNFIFRFC